MSKFNYIFNRKVINEALDEKEKNTVKDWELELATCASSFSKHNKIVIEDLLKKFKKDEAYIIPSEKKNPRLVWTSKYSNLEDISSYDLPVYINGYIAFAAAEKLDTIVIADKQNNAAALFLFSREDNSPSKLLDTSIRGKAIGNYDSKASYDLVLSFGDETDFLKINEISKGKGYSIELQHYADYDYRNNTFSNRSYGPIGDVKINVEKYILLAFGKSGLSEYKKNIGVTNTIKHSLIAEEFNINALYSVDFEGLFTDDNRALIIDMDTVINNINNKNNATLLIYASLDPYDLMGMTNDRYWQGSSCMVSKHREETRISNAHYIKHDIEQSTIILYGFKSSYDTKEEQIKHIEEDKPDMRVLLKRVYGKVDNELRMYYVQDRHYKNNSDRSLAENITKQFTKDANLLCKYINDAMYSDEKSEKCVIVDVGNLYPNDMLQLKYDKKNIELNSKLVVSALQDYPDLVKIVNDSGAIGLLDYFSNNKEAYNLINSDTKKALNDLYSKIDVDMKYILNGIYVHELFNKDETVDLSILIDNIKSTIEHKIQVKFAYNDSSYILTHYSNIKVEQLKYLESLGMTYRITSLSAYANNYSTSEEVLEYLLAKPNIKVDLVSEMDRFGLLDNVSPERLPIILTQLNISITADNLSKHGYMLARNPYAAKMLLVLFDRLSQEESSTFVSKFGDLFMLYVLNRTIIKDSFADMKKLIDVGLVTPNITNIIISNIKYNDDHNALILMTLEYAIKQISELLTPNLVLKLIAKFATDNNLSIVSMILKTIFNGNFNGNINDIKMDMINSSDKLSVGTIFMLYKMLIKYGYKINISDIEEHSTNYHYENFKEYTTFITDYIESTNKITSESIGILNNNINKVLKYQSENEQQQFIQHIKDELIGRKNSNDTFNKQDVDNIKYYKL